MGIHENRKSSGKGHSQGPDPDSAREVTALRQKRLIYNNLGFASGQWEHIIQPYQGRDPDIMWIPQQQHQNKHLPAAPGTQPPFEPRVPHEISGSRIEDFCQEEHIIMSLPPDFRTRGQAGQAMSGKPKLV